MVPSRPAIPLLLLVYVVPPRPVISLLLLVYAVPRQGGGEPYYCGLGCRQFGDWYSVEKMVSGVTRTPWSAVPRQGGGYPHSLVCGAMSRRGVPAFSGLRGHVNIIFITSPRQAAPFPPPLLFLPSPLSPPARHLLSCPRLPLTPLPPLACPPPSLSPPHPPAPLPALQSPACPPTASTPEP